MNTTFENYDRDFEYNFSCINGEEYDYDDYDYSFEDDAIEYDLDYENGFDIDILDDIDLDDDNHWDDN